MKYASWGTAGSVAAKNYVVDLSAPPTGELRLSRLLQALETPACRALLRRLLADAYDIQGLVEHPREFFGSLSSGRSNLHLHALRYAGWVHQRPGRSGLLTRLRRDDIEARFPGLLAYLTTRAVPRLAPQDTWAPPPGVGRS